MWKKLAIGCIALAGVYALVSGDYTFAGPRYQVLAYAYLAAAQFDSPRPATQGAGTERAEAGTDVGRTPAAAPGYVHLGSLRSAASAQAEWWRLQESFPAHLGDLQLIVERVQMDAEGVFYRVLADTAESPLSPRQLCSALRQSDQYCTPVDPGAS